VVVYLLKHFLISTVNKEEKKREKIGEQRGNKSRKCWKTERKGKVDEINGEMFSPN